MRFLVVPPDSLAEIGCIIRTRHRANFRRIKPGFELTSPIRHFGNVTLKLDLSRTLPLAFTFNPILGGTVPLVEFAPQHRD